MIVLIRMASKMVTSKIGFVTISYSNRLVLLSGGLTEKNFDFAFRISLWRSIQLYCSKVIIESYFFSFLSCVLYSLKSTPTKRFIKKKEPRHRKRTQNNDPEIKFLSLLGPLKCWINSYRKLTSVSESLSIRSWYINGQPSKVDRTNRVRSPRNTFWKLAGWWILQSWPCSRH